MKVTEIRSYRRGDLAKIPGRDDFTALLAENPFDCGEPDRDSSFSLIGENGCPKACGGFVRERTGVYMLWGYCSPSLTRRDWLLIAAQVRDILAHLFRTGAHRVHSLAAADNAAAVKYLMHIGLGTDMNRLVAYGPQGEDYILLAAIRELGV